MPVTLEAPGPWILDTAPSTGTLLGCEGARKAMENFLYAGEEIGEDDLFVTYGYVYPLVSSWAELVEETYQIYIAASKHASGMIQEEDMDYQRVLFLRERAAFYLEVLDSVKDSDLAYQREEINTYIMRPLFFGLHFRSYFDSESEVIEAPADYCLPQLLLNNLGYSVNWYRNFANLILYVWGPQGEQAAYDAWGDLPSDAADSVVPYETVERAVEEHLVPVAENLKEVADATVDVVAETGKTLLKVIKNPFDTAVALGALIYLFSARKK